ncbi:MAG: MopE-related protein [Saprospiraceae bacterium]
MNCILFLLGLTVFQNDIHAQCPAGQIELTVTYQSASNDAENSWLLWDATTGTELLCDDAPAVASANTVCVVVGHTINLYVWETNGDGWNNSTIAISYSEDGSNNGGNTRNKVAYGTNGNPGNIASVVMGNGSLDNCPGGSPSDGSGGVLATTFTALAPLPLYSECPWTLNMFDNAGDGWSTGERLNVSVDGEPSFAYYVYGGTSQTETVYVTKGGTFDQDFAIGSFSSEVSWELVNDEGTTVYSANGSPNPNPIAQISTTCADVIPIVLTCPADVTAECSDDLEPATQGEATYTGGTGTVTVTHSDAISGGSCTGQYTITRTWTATDNVGSETCDQIIEVEDNTPPVIVCPSNLTIACSENDTPASTGNASATDNCTDPAFIMIGHGDVITPGNCPGNYTITRTWTATDPCAKFSNCNQIITVEDIIPPVISCPAATTIECSDDSSPANTGEPSATDNCSLPNNITFGSSDAITPGSCPGNYTITRTWTATDECNKSSNCNQTITVEDTTPPLIVTCPTDQGPIEWPTGFNITPVAANTPQDPSIHPSNYNNMVYTELCGTVTITYQDALIGPSPANCPTLWIVKRTWTITDECGLSSQCVQTFTFIDTTNPTITCPADPAPIEWTAGFNTTPVGPNTPQDNSISPAIYGTATASDNCGSPTVTYQDELMGPSPANCPNLWLVKRTWTATDACGLTDVCVQTFTFKDTTPPVIGTCPPNRNVEGCTLADITNGDLTALAFSNTPTMVSENDFTNEGGVATDNCGIQSYAYQDVANGTCPIVVTRTWTVTDVCGQTVICTQTITIDDTTPPTAACLNISISLNANGQYNLAPAQIFDAANASDNCGAVVPLSASPNYFSCPQEGANNVVLTVEDDCGNTATCTAIVTVADFITNINVSSTNEGCAGAGNGTITISATAAGGQVGYSIDGGANFNFTGFYSTLSPGTYNIVIKVFGIPAVCVETATVTVGAGGTPTTWYKDEDGDGYSDGITVVSCSQPTGYIANPSAGTDCDDNNAAIHPGAAEICDGLDNDCDGILGADEVDADGDGYMVCEDDCNDGDPTIHPFAIELCDGIDNDCNGLVDDGISTTYVGNIAFSSQAQLNNWAACYTTIQGSVTISGSNITNLGPLSNITVITGNLLIYNNPVLTSLNGLGNLTAVGGSLYMYYNFQLSNCCAISDLLENGGVSGAVVIFYNASGSSCNSPAAIITSCPTIPPVVDPFSEVASVPAVSLSVERPFNVYPNPAHDTFTAQFNKADVHGQLQVRDLLGRVFLTMEVEKGTEQVTVDFNKINVESGIYLVTLIENGEAQTERLVVHRN